MTLRRKTLLIIAGTFYGVIILLFFISRTILLESYSDLERQSTQRDVERVLTAYSQVLSSLDTTTADRAAWDDTYAFIADPGEEYIRSNLTDSTFAELGLNLMLYKTLQGKPFSAKHLTLKMKRKYLSRQAFQRIWLKMIFCLPIRTRKAVIPAPLSFPKAP